MLEGFRNCKEHTLPAGTRLLRKGQAFWSTSLELLNRMVQNNTPNG